MSDLDWEDLLSVTDANIKEKLDELYAFILTKELQSQSPIARQPKQLCKILSTIQTIFRVSNNHMSYNLICFSLLMSKRQIYCIKLHKYRNKN